jgi:hypothetical protein
VIQLACGSKNKRAKMSRRGYRQSAGRRAVSNSQRTHSVQPVLESGKIVRMGEHLLRVLLDELVSARIKCAREPCKTSVEMSIGEIGKLDNAPCPGCQKPFGRGTANMKARLSALASAIDDVLEMRDVYTVEFPVRLDGREDAPK